MLVLLLIRIQAIELDHRSLACTAEGAIHELVTVKGESGLVFHSCNHMDERFECGLLVVAIAVERASHLLDSRVKAILVGGSPSRRRCEDFELIDVRREDCLTDVGCALMVLSEFVARHTHVQRAALLVYESGRSLIELAARFTERPVENLPRRGDPCVHPRIVVRETPNLGRSVELAAD